MVLPCLPWPGTRVERRWATSVAGQRSTAPSPPVAVRHSPHQPAAACATSYWRRGCPCWSRSRGFCRAFLGQERELSAAGRPAWLANARLLRRRRSLFATRHINQQQLARLAIGAEVALAGHDREGFAVPSLARNAS